MKKIQNNLTVTDINKYKSLEKKGNNLVNAMMLTSAIESIIKIEGLPDTPEMRKQIVMEALGNGSQPKIYITKVKCDTGNKPEITYIEIENPLDYTHLKKVSFECSDIPHQDYVNAVRDMVEHAKDICCLVDDNQDWTTISVSIKYDDSFEPKGCVITSIRKIKECSSPMIINTPYVPFDSNNDEITADYRLVLKAINEAKAYINGKRAVEQMKLDLKSA